MLRALVCWVLCHAAASVRIAKKSGRTANLQSQKEARPQSNASLVEQGSGFSFAAVSSAWKGCQPCKSQTLTVNMYDNIATMDQQKDLGKQIVNMVNIGLSVALSMINPALGLAWSVMAGLFGLGGDPEDAMVKQILERVKKMISQSLSNFAHSLNQQYLSSLMTNIQTADTAAEWRIISHDFSVQKIFNMSCYSSIHDPGNKACYEWHTTFGKGEALILEIEFTHLMLNSWLEMKRAAVDSNLTVEFCQGQSFNRHCADFETYVDQAEDLEHKVLKAWILLERHMKVWEQYRMKDEHFLAARVSSVRTRPGDKHGCLGGKVFVYQGVDKITKKHFEGPSCRKDGHVTCKSSLRSRELSYSNVCREEWKEAVKQELAGLKEEVAAISKMVTFVAGCHWPCYLKRYPDIARVYGATSTEGGRLHYLEFGVKEGRNCKCAQAAPACYKAANELADPRCANQHGQWHSGCETNGPEKGYGAGTLYDCRGRFDVGPQPL